MPTEKVSESNDALVAHCVFVIFTQKSYIRFHLLRFFLALVCIQYAQIISITHEKPLNQEVLSLEVRT